MLATRHAVIAWYRWSGFRMAERTAGATVMVASNNGAFRHNLANALANEGYWVDEERLQPHVLSRLVSTSSCQPAVEVVVLDLAGASREGLALLEAIRRRDWALRVLMVHKANDDDARVEAQRLGANATFTHPTDIEALRQILHDVAPLA